MAPGPKTNSGAAVVPIGSAGVGVSGKVVVHVTAVANPGKFVGRVRGAGADIDLKCKSAADPDAAAAATFAAPGIYYVEDHGAMDISLSFGNGDTTYLVSFAST